MLQQIGRCVQHRPAGGAYRLLAARQRAGGGGDLAGDQWTLANSRRRRRVGQHAPERKPLCGAERRQPDGFAHYALRAVDRPRAVSQSKIAMSANPREARQASAGIAPPLRQKLIAPNARAMRSTRTTVSVSAGLSTNSAWASATSKHPPAFGRELRRQGALAAAGRRDDLDLKRSLRCALQKKAHALQRQGMQTGKVRRGANQCDGRLDSGIAPGTLSKTRRATAGSGKPGGALRPWILCGLKTASPSATPSKPESGPISVPAGQSNSCAASQGVAWQTLRIVVQIAVYAAHTPTRSRPRPRVPEESASQASSAKQPHTADHSRSRLAAWSASAMESRRARAPASVA